MKTLSRKLLGYALGRTVQISDQPLIDQLISAGGNITVLAARRGDRGQPAVPQSSGARNRHRGRSSKNSSTGRCTMNFRSTDTPSFSAGRRRRSGTAVDGVPARKRLRPRPPRISRRCDSRASISRTASPPRTGGPRAAAPRWSSARRPSRSRRSARTSSSSRASTTIRRSSIRARIWAAWPTCSRARASAPTRPISASARPWTRCSRSRSARRPRSRASRSASSRMSCGWKTACR